MNPIDKWEKLRNEEIMQGGKPTICIMGHDDYAKFCGAVAAINGLLSFGNSPETIYQGVRLFESRANPEGMMFA